MAPWWATQGASNPWPDDCPPPYQDLVGFQGPEMIHGDLLHLFHLGVGRDMCGSILRIVLGEQRMFPGRRIELRLAEATSRLKAFASASRTNLRLKKLTKTKLNWKSNAFPELRSSGFDTKVVVSWLAHEFVALNDPSYHPEIATLLWSADTVMRTMACSGRWMTQEELDTKTVCGQLFVRLYLTLADRSMVAREKLWRLRPKFHMLNHSLCSRPASKLNPWVFSTWMDEDAVRRQMHLVRAAHARTCQSRTLQRWLLGFPAVLASCQRNRVRG